MLSPLRSLRLTEVTFRVMLLLKDATGIKTRASDFKSSALSNLPRLSLGPLFSHVIVIVQILHSPPTTLFHHSPVAPFLFFLKDFWAQLIVFKSPQVRWQGRGTGLPRNTPGGSPSLQLQISCFKLSAYSNRCSSP